MRLKAFTIQGFRGYRNPVTIQFDPDMTGITGRNDAGKSSILEALDIFFEGGEVKLEKDDFNIGNGGADIVLTCYFDELPAEIVIDDTNTTNLTDEYLLNPDGDLEIRKRFKKSSPTKPAVYIVADHPSNENAADLHSLKIADLRARGREMGIDNDAVADERVCAAWRVGIWGHLGDDLRKDVVELPIDSFADDAKKLKDRIFKALPLFALFRSDRESKDSDPHAKSPLQNAVKLAQAELSDEIERIQQEVQQKVIERANRTIEKLNEMDPTLASELKPQFKSPPKWTFDFRLDGDDDIPVNKRGSGVRRLILLNFFRAEAERRVEAEEAPSVVYAIEEPETSQHPSNQELLIRALLDVAVKPNCQVVLTTHVPALAGLLPVDGLCFVEKRDNHPVVLAGTDDVLATISDSLGVLPDSTVSGAKGLVLVEGAGDIIFIRHTCQTLRDAGHLPSTLEDRGIYPVIIGGCGNLKHWITKRVADQFGVPWGVLLDSDLGSTQTQNIATVEGLRADGRIAYATRKREPENYLSPVIVAREAELDEEPVYGDEDDAKAIIAQSCGIKSTDVMDRFWPHMTAEHIRIAENYTDVEGNERYELTEIILDFLGLVE